MNQIEFEEFAPILNANLAFCIGVQEKNVYQKDGKIKIILNNKREVVFSYDLPGLAEKLSEYYGVIPVKNGNDWETEIYLDQSNKGIKVIGVDKKLVIAIAVIGKFLTSSVVPYGFIEKEISPEHKIRVKREGVFPFEEIF